MVNDGEEWGEADAPRYANGRPRSKDALQRAGEWAVHVQLHLIFGRDNFLQLA